MSKTALLRNTDLLSSSNIQKTSAFRSEHADAFLLLQNLLAEMEDCSILMLTTGVFKEKWNPSPERAESYLKLLEEQKFLSCFRTSGKVMIITPPDFIIETSLDETAVYDAVILLSDEDSVDDFKNLQVIGFDQ